MYIDYEREGLAKFMTHDGAAAPLVKDSGNIVEAAYNLHGDLANGREESSAARTRTLSDAKPVCVIFDVISRTTSQKKGRL